MCMRQGAIYLFANWLLYLFMSYAVTLLCGRRYSFWKTFAIQAAAAAANLTICMYLQQLSAFRLFVGTFLFVAVTAWLHSGKPALRILYSLLAFLSMLLAEIILMAILPRDASLSGVIYEQHPIELYTVVVFINVLVLAVMVAVIRFIRSRSHGDAAGGGAWMLFVVFPIGQIAILWVFMQNYLFISYKPLYFYLTLGIYLASDVCLVAAARVYSMNSQLQARTEILEEEVGFQRDYYAQLSSTFESIRRMRHDIDNHLYTMQALLADGKVEEATEYAGKVAAYDTARLKFAECRNMVAASYLEKKSEDLEKLGVAFETEVRLPAELAISSPDLICVLGNLLDNAQEACRSVPEPRIVLKARYKKPYLTITCGNTAAEGEEPPRKRRIAELGRGVGFTILNDLAAKYDGQFYTERRGGWFDAGVILKDEETESC